MKYHKLLDLKREPFANSPNPDLLYLTARHRECLQQLEMAVHLRRGLSVVVGEVGTGKTTICRRLIRSLGKGHHQCLIRLLLDPDYHTPDSFLLAIARSFRLVGEPPEDLSGEEIKERLRKFLFEQGVRQGRIVLLIIDEGQKLPDSCLEILRGLLNYETNEEKLLQVLIFAQEEFQSQVARHAYFRDRIAYWGHLRPLDFRETRALINFRLSQCQGRQKLTALFTWPALWQVYRHSRGYPRRIVMLCSQLLLTFAARRFLADSPGPRRIRTALVRECGQRVLPRHWVWRDEEKHQDK